MAANTQPPSLRDGVRSVWTDTDEARLRELIERKERIVKESRAAVREAFVTVFGELVDTSDGIEDIVDTVIMNAKAMRDALAPFDDRVSK